MMTETFDVVSEQMKPLPRDGDIAVGTYVWGSDFNAASALLYRWWGLLDAPLDADTSRFWDDLFDADPVISTPDVSAQGMEALRRAVAATKLLGPSAHHLDYDDFRLTWCAPDLFAIEAVATHQRADAAQRFAYAARVRKRADGRLVLKSISATALDAPSPKVFAPSYITNRARATSVRFQAHMDGLSGKTDDMGDLLMAQVELHGLVASKKDETASGRTLIDVNDLRKSIAGSDEVSDNVIRDFPGFTAWFSTCTDLFTYGLHKLESFSVKPLDDRRFEIVAQYDWRAETLNGAKIETHHPLTWILVDTDEAYMRIEKLLPFG